MNKLRANSKKHIEKPKDRLEVTPIMAFSGRPKLKKHCNMQSSHPDLWLSRRGPRF